MINLVPSWAHNYDAFWDAIKKRNLWFIKLRYGAVVLLSLFLISSDFMLGVKFTNQQVFALTAINLSILLYNISFHIYRRKLKTIPGQFNPLHFSLLQMILDLCALYLLVYFTGTIESPLYMLFIFHMIIGSLILPGSVIYSLAVLIIAAFSSLVILEYSGIIIHHTLTGFLAYPIYSDLNYCIAFCVIFAFSIIVSVLLANKIAHQLYRMEQELVESLKKINEAERDKQKYIISVIHEIKSPLAAVHSYLEIVLDKIIGPLNEKVEEKLRRAKSRSVEAFGLIDNILKISKLRLLDDIKKEDVKIDEVIGSLVEKFNDSIKNKNIKIDIIDSRESMKILKADTFLIQMIFSNIIGNAIKYIGEEGKIIITLNDNDNMVEIKVSDNGIGIPDSDKEKIFDDFYRASNIKSLGYEGAGLGLSAVKQIVNRHNGKIAVESPSDIGTKEKPGSSFKIILPY
ncbi:MAG: HAMP domain-containing sensor histidine kinase [Ignavibacteriaceae bacterium]